MRLTWHLCGRGRPCAMYALVQLVVATTPSRANGTIAAADPGTDDRAMRTPTPSRCAIVATTVGLIVSLSLVGCSRGAVESPTSALVGCLLLQHHGELVALNGRPVLTPLDGTWGGRSGPVPLDWPDGWTIRPADGGQLEVLDAGGSVQGTTGARVIVYTDGSIDTPEYNGDGEFVVCDADPYR
jgi:hypothetical protein